MGTLGQHLDAESNIWASLGQSLVIQEQHLYMQGNIQAAWGGIWVLQFKTCAMHATSGQLGLHLGSPLAMFGEGVQPSLNPLGTWGTRTFHRDSPAQGNAPSCLG